MYTPPPRAARDLAPTVTSPLTTTITMPSSPGKTGWEREDTTSTTPSPFFTSNTTASPHQHSSSLLEFFRGRKASISKASAAYHQAAAAAAASVASATSSVPLPTPLPLKSTPPMISKSRLGSSTSPIPPPIRKQSLDVSQFSGYHNNPLHRAQQHERHAAAMPVLSTSSSTPSISITTSDSKVSGVVKGYYQDPSPMTPTPESFKFPLSPPISNTPSHSVQQQQQQSHHSPPPPPQQQQQPQSQHQHQHSSIASSFSKVAAAVVGATVGKRRPSVSSTTFSELESGTQDLKESGQQQTIPSVPGLNIKGSPIATQGLDQEQVNRHVRFMKSEKSAAELAIYADRLYYTVLNKDVALDYSKKQISVLQKELDQTRAQAEESKKALIEEVDRVKGQVVMMDENFLLWRTKVHNDQIAQQEDYLHERLITQDRIEELEEDLNSSQEEVTRLRNRLVTLEYEDGWVGSSSFLPTNNNNYNNSNESSPSASSFASSPNEHQSNNSQRSSQFPDSTTVDFGPMTVATHKRRSQDFHMMELKAQSFEGQVQELMRVLELERQDRQKDFTEFKMRMQAQCSKLEQEAQAAKMESTMYNEMMHEVVTENDDLRKQIKHVKRNSKYQSHGSGNNNNSNGKHCIYNRNINNSNSNSNSSSSSVGTIDFNRHRQDDFFGYPSSEIDGRRSDSLYGSEDEMEEIAI